MKKPNINNYIITIPFLGLLVATIVFFGGLSFIGGIGFSMVLSLILVIIYTMRRDFSSNEGDIVKVIKE